MSEHSPALAREGSVMSRVVSFLVLVAILIVIAVVFFRVMAGFLVPLFLAALLGVVVQPLYRWMLFQCRGYRYAAAGITTSLVLVAVLLPIALVVTTATLEGLSIIDQLQLSNVRSKLDELRSEAGLKIPHEIDVRYVEARLRRWREQQREGITPDVTPGSVQNLLERVDKLDQWVKTESLGREADAGFLRDALTNLRESQPESVERDEQIVSAEAEFKAFKRQMLGGTYRAFLTELANPSDEQLDQLRKAMLSTAGDVAMLGSGTAVFFAKLVFGIVIMMVSLFFMLAEGSRMLNAIVRISPLEEHHVRELVAEFDRACRAIVSATLLSAVAQGLLAGVGFYFAGLTSSVALLMLLTMVLALVPFAGAVMVWLPVSLYLYFYQDNLWAAVGLAVYGGVIVSQADNIIKPYILSGQSKLHPLLALLSVLGGIQALGPIGILVGPMVVVFLQTLLKLLQRELSSLDKVSWPNWPGLAAFTGRKSPESPPPSSSATESPPTSNVADHAGKSATASTSPAPRASEVPPAISPSSGNGHSSSRDARRERERKKRGK
ncbi:MAG: AI-2E family transporter [Pirellulaceae bacterium]|nr:AI-2E family transporter [Pirellulaceae bacterium]